MGRLKQEVLFCGLKLCGSGIPEKYNQISKLSKLNKTHLKKYQMEKLKKCIQYAYHNVPYYHKVLAEAGVMTDDKDSIDWNCYMKIPKLTKELIRDYKKELQSRDRRIKGIYANHSGGSTGMPIEIWQDREYNEWNIANSLFLKTFGGYRLGDKELRLWGSESDLLENKEKMSLRVRNRIYGRKELNSFKMSLDNMEHYVDIWNQYKPEWVEAYAQSVYELGVFIKKNRMKIHTPKGIVTSAGTLYPSMRTEIETIFGCRVFNRYGSREVGGMACNCTNETDLHLSVWNHYVEILDNNMQPVKQGQIGKVYVTTLNNRVMPLIRYEIGDIAEKVEWDHGCCRYGMPLLKGLEGRDMSVIRTRDGKIVPGEFFIHFIGVVYNSGFIDKFQVIQHDYEKLEIKAQILDDNEFEKMRDKIESAIKLEMTDRVQIIWSKVESIPCLQSGKYLYVYSKIDREGYQ